MTSVEALIGAQEIFLPFSAESIALAKAYRSRLGVEPSDEEAALIFSRSIPNPQISAAGVRAFFEAKRRICPWLRLLDPQKIPSARSTPKSGTPVNRQMRRSSPISIETAARLFAAGNLSASKNPELDMATKVVEYWIGTASENDVSVDGLVQAWAAQRPDIPMHEEFFPVLERYVAGEWFDLSGCFSRRFGYKTRDPARLFDFWKFLRAENSLEPGMKGFSKSQVLQFIEDDDEEVVSRPLANPEPRTPPRFPINRPPSARIEQLAKPRERKPSVPPSRSNDRRLVQSALIKNIKKFIKEISDDFSPNSDLFFDSLFCVCIAQIPLSQIDEAAATYQATFNARSSPLSQPLALNRVDSLYSVLLPEPVALSALEIRISCQLDDVQLNYGPAPLLLAISDHRGRSTFTTEFDLPIGRVSTVLLEFSAVLKDKMHLEISSDFHGVNAEVLTLKYATAVGGLAGPKFKALVRDVALTKKEEKVENRVFQEQARPSVQAPVRAAPKPRREASPILRPCDTARALRAKIARARSNKKIPLGLEEEISRLPEKLKEGLMAELKVLQGVRPKATKPLKPIPKLLDSRPGKEATPPASEKMSAPPPPPPRQPCEPLTFRKRMCLHWLETGTCPEKENQCPFAHSVAERNVTQMENLEQAMNAVKGLKLSENRLASSNTAPAPPVNPRPHATYSPAAYQTVQ